VVLLIMFITVLKERRSFAWDKEMLNVYNLIQVSMQKDVIY